MYYLSFDVSKAKLDIALTNLKTKTAYFTIANNHDSISEWIDFAKLPKKLIAGCESTGGYHLELARVCVENKIPFKIINPILTKQFIKTTIRKKKTDQSDALIIAKLLAQGNGQTVSEKELDMESKVMGRMLKKFSQFELRLKQMQNSLQYHNPSVLLQSLGSAMEQARDVISNIRQDQFTLLEEKYSDIPEIKLLVSITGIGFKTAFAIWSEIGNIEKFPHSKQLIAFAGFDPKIRQSGHSLNSYGKLTKRGSPRLRNAIFVAANVARMHDPELRDYYEKKRKEGKSYTVAVCATSRKLIERIYAVLQRGTPYIKVKKESAGLANSKGRLSGVLT